MQTASTQRSLGRCQKKCLCSVVEPLDRECSLVLGMIGFPLFCLFFFFFCLMLSSFLPLFLTPPPASFLRNGFRWGFQLLSSFVFFLSFFQFFFPCYLPVGFSSFGTFSTSDEQRKWYWYQAYRKACWTPVQETHPHAGTTSLSLWWHITDCTPQFSAMGARTHDTKILICWNRFIQYVFEYTIPSLITELHHCWLFALMTKLCCHVHIVQKIIFN